MQFPQFGHFRGVSPGKVLGQRLPDLREFHTEADNLAFWKNLPATESEDSKLPADHLLPSRGDRGNFFNPGPAPYIVKGVESQHIYTCITWNGYFNNFATDH